MQGFLIFGSAAVLIVILSFVDYYAQDFLNEQEKTKHEERKPITMKIKTFEFEVCNWSELATYQDTRSIDYRKAQERIATPEKIDETINEFCKNKNVISINTNTIDMNYHNNGRANWIKMIYTIVYDDNND